MCNKNTQLSEVDAEDKTSLQQAKSHGIVDDKNTKERNFDFIIEYKLSDKQLLDLTHEAFLSAIARSKNQQLSFDCAQKAMEKLDVALSDGKVFFDTKGHFVWVTKKNKPARSPLKAWVKTIAKNAFIDELRRLKRFSVYDENQDSQKSPHSPNSSMDDDLDGFDSDYLEGLLDDISEYESEEDWMTGKSKEQTDLVELHNEDLIEPELFDGMSLDQLEAEFGDEYDENAEAVLSNNEYSPGEQVDDVINKQPSKEAELLITLTAESVTETYKKFLNKTYRMQIVIVDGPNKNRPTSWFIAQFCLIWFREKHNGEQSGEQKAERITQNSLFKRLGFEAKPNSISDQKKLFQEDVTYCLINKLNKLLGPGKVDEKALYDLWDVHKKNARKKDDKR